LWAPCPRSRSPSSRATGRRGLLPSDDTPFLWRRAGPHAKTVRSTRPCRDSQLSLGTTKGPKRPAWADMLRGVVIRHHDMIRPGVIASGVRGRAVPPMAVQLFPMKSPLHDAGRRGHVIVRWVRVARSRTDHGSAEGVGGECGTAAGSAVLGICFGAQRVLCAGASAAESRPLVWPRSLSVVHGSSGARTLVPAGPGLEFHNERCRRTPSTTGWPAQTRLAVSRRSLGRHFAVQFTPGRRGRMLKQLGWT